MGTKIQLRRGLKADLPTLDNGEVGFAQDTEELFIGSSSGNKKLTFDATKYDSYDAQLADMVTLGKTLEGGTSDKDNYSSLVSLVSNAKTNKKTLYIPNGKYYVSDNLTIEGINNIIIDGEIVMASGKTLEILYTSNLIDSCDWKINTVTGKLRLTGVKNGRVTVLFATELELYADGNDVKRRSIAYSQFWLGNIGIFKIFSDGTGWINENSFYGGRISNLSIDGGYTHNNNTFYKPMLENATINIVRGSSNFLKDVRFEGTNTITFGTNSFGNMIEVAWRSTNASLYSTLAASSHTVTDNGVGNLVTQTQHKDLLVDRIVDLNYYTENMDYSILQKENGKVKYTQQVQDIVSTGVIPYPTFPIGFTTQSDVGFFRQYVHFYDSAMNPIQMDSAIITTGLTWSSTNNRYQAGSNLSSNRVMLSPNPSIAYFEIKLATGSGVTSLINYLTFDVICKKTDQYRYITERLKRKVAKPLATDPTQLVGTFDLDSVVYNKNRSAGGKIGWTPISLSPLTWKAFGVIDA